jgi:peptidoglycan/xylan/chitin deacetylase (PgdA/CDA1 family)
MRYIYALTVLLFSTTAHAADPTFAWPHAEHAAIVLTYDDAVPSDLTVAIPQLDRAGLKGTFFLMGKAMHVDDLPRRRAAAAAGHELANHTINHPCARGTYEMPAQYTSETYSVDVLLAEINTMNVLLTAIDGRPKHALATPCEQTKVGSGADKKDYIAPLQASGLVTYIRDSSVPVTSVPVPRVSSIGFIGTSGPDMIAWVKEVEKSGGVGIIVFHGVGGDYLSVSADAHQQLLDYLGTHRTKIWTTTYTETMDYVVKHAH